MDFHRNVQRVCCWEQVGPQKLAGEVCAELASKVSLPAHELCLEEVVCGGALTRPLHHMERVLDVVLRWGYWSDIDRKDNCLVLCQNTVFKEAAAQVCIYRMLHSLITRSFVICTLRQA
jgi:hypothetical protein